MFQQGEAPTRPFVRLASVAAHGNRYASDELLCNTLREEAARLGADFVIVLQKQISNDESVGAYSGGIMVSSPIQRPHLHGIACRYSQVQLGVYLSPEGVVNYVKPGGSASAAGLREGDKILAINGTFYGLDACVAEREVHTRSPGDTVTLEILTTGGERVTKEVVLQAAAG